MSVISLHYVDDSSSVAKEFASIAADQFARNSGESLTGPSRVPFENLFRLLDMFRFDSYADETRSGVLALGSHEPISALPVQPEWNLKITEALNGSLGEVFPGTPKDQAVDQLQDSIRTVARGLRLPAEQSHRAQDFFNRFSELV